MATDPLTAMREFVTGNPTTFLQEVVEDAETITFGHHTYEKTELTAWRKNSDENYTVQVVWFCVKCAELNYSAYLTEASGQRVGAVVLRDFKDVIDYVHGRVETSSRIDENAQMSYIPRPGISDRPTKKIKTSDSGAEPKVSGSALEPASASAATDGAEMPKADIGGAMKDDDGVARGGAEDAQNLTDERESNEFFFKTRETMLMVPPTHKGFADVPQLFGSLQKRGVKTTQANGRYHRGTGPHQMDGPPPPPLTAAQGPGTAGHRGHHRDQIPIILVPSAISSKINMSNAREFLENHNYVPYSARSKGTTPGGEGKNEKDKHFTIEVPGFYHRGKVQYQVRSHPPSPSSPDWHRVVAVFVLGKAWQFKSYKWQPPELFAHAKGFHVHFDNEQPPPKTRSWHVDYVKLKKEFRHHDRKIIHQFWETLKKSMKVHKNKRLLF